MAHNTLILLISFLLASLSYSQIPDSEVLSYATTCKVDINNKLSIERSYLIQINNKQGEDLTDIVIPYSKGNKVYELKGWIKDKNGLTVRILKKSDISEASNYHGTFYTDYLEKYFTLKHNTYPYQIFYSYLADEYNYLWIESWHPVIDIKTPTKKASLKIEIPKDYPINIRQSKIENFKTDTLESSITYSWQAEYLNPLKEEIYSPNLIDLIPQVDVIPVKFNYGIPGNMTSWVSYGNWLHDLSKGLNALPPAETVKIKGMINGIDDPKMKIKILYQYMQDNTRYINVSIGVGGMKPQPAEYVSLNKYGDCKALTNYMQTLLQIANIPSYSVDVFSASAPRKIHENFPSQQFNHVILCVPLEKDTIWLENTSNITPAGYIGTSIQNRYGLLIANGKSHLIKIPSLKPEGVKELIKTNYYIDEKSKVTADINCKFKGKMYENFINVKSNLSLAEQNRIMENLQIKNYELNKWDIYPTSRDSSHIIVQLNLTLNHFIKDYENNFIIRPNPIGLPPMESPNNRKLSLQINYPIYKVDSTIFNVSNIHEVTKLSEDAIITSDFGYFSIQLKQENNKVVIHRTFKLLPGEYPLETYPKFYAFINEVKTKDQKIYINLVKK